MITIRHLDIQPYDSVWENMKQFTLNRDDYTPDELWLLEHHPVYTQGQAGKAEHILNASDIPIVQSDRGGQVTYHGPGQLVGYVMMNLNRRNLGVRTLVCRLEEVLIALLASLNIESQTHCGAPGVYVGDKKIASIGLRVKKGCTYHGIALNVSMDLTPFEGINPCGFAKMQMAQITDYEPDITVNDVAKLFEKHFLTLFNHK